MRTNGPVRGATLRYLPSVPPAYPIRLIDMRVVTGDYKLVSVGTELADLRGQTRDCAPPGGVEFSI